MIRQIKCSALSVVVCILITSTFADGPQPVPERQYGELKNQLNNSRMERAFGNKKIEVLDIISATEEVNNGKSYNILAKISINGRTEKCCFVAQNFFPRQHGYFIIKATVGAKKCKWIKFRQPFQLEWISW